MDAEVFPSAAIPERFDVNNEKKMLAGKTLTEENEKVSDKMKEKCKQSEKIKYSLNCLEKDAAVICQDFDIFCDYVLENKVKLTKKTGNIGKNDCFTLNTLFYIREEYEKPTYFQNRYSIINFFYYIAVKYKILEIDVTGTTLQQGRNYQFFYEASIWEQYILFLAVFMFDGVFVGEVNSWYADEAAYRWQIYVDSFMEWFDMKKPRAVCIYSLY